MKTSESPRKTIARKPSHFGSYRNRPPSGSSSESLASIGSIGGAIGNPLDICHQCTQRHTRCCPSAPKRQRATGYRQRAGVAAHVRSARGATLAHEDDVLCPL